MLELYTHPKYSCAQKVRIVLAEKGLEWTAHHVSLQDEENLEPWYLELNPLGVVPTLVQFDWTALFEADCPRVADWFARCRERTSYQKGVAEDLPDKVMTDLRTKGAAVWDRIAAHLD